MRILVARAILVALSFVGIPAGASASEGTSGVDFAGKTITIVIGFGAGGGYDAFGRLAADHLGRFLPGEPTVIVENMPGGSGRRALVYIATAAPKDGTVITIPSANFVVDALRGTDAGVVDPATFGIIGRLSDARELEVTWADSPTRTFADAQKRETMMASDGPTGNGSTVLRVLNAYFGTKFKLIEGYSGTAEMALAMERGEVEGMVASMQVATTTHPEWFAEKKVNVLWQQAADRSPDFPDVPALVEFARNDEERALLDLLVSQGQIGKTLAAPPGVAEDVLSAFRDGYAAMMKDPVFIADAKKRMLPLVPGTPEEISHVIEATLGSDPKVVRQLTGVIDEAAQ